MALKDWKKRKSLPYDNWVKTIEHYPYRQFIYLSARYSVDNKGYIVEINDKKISKTFKTKSQALKFAKSYMRIH